ncbi:MAG: 4Fe-4S dicluster domain-containing protein [Desulfosarcinaceae bacterium]|nr:4Fe-4S dicluster domain-containing protein [Desulfosarcinaceae bacterium]
MALQRFIKTNFDLCTGCSLCQLACSQRLLGGYNPHRAVLKITHSCENLYHHPVVCNQCRNPYCANVCPVGAISREAATGAMVVDRERCVGCNLCHRYCPIGVVGVDPALKKSVKCDLCGGSPRCVGACPTGALELAHNEPAPLNQAAETGEGAVDNG